MIEIESLQSPAQLPELHDFWNHNVIYDPMPQHILLEKTFGDSDFNPELTLIARKEKQIVAFMQGLIRQIDQDFRRGYIKLFATDQNYRRQGIATMLLKRIERHMQRIGVQSLRLMDCNPNYFQPGIDPRYTEAIAFAERNGFRRFADTANLEVDLQNQNFDTSREEQQLAQEQIIIRRATKEDWPLVEQLILNHFKAWLPEIQTTYTNNPISLHIAEYNGKIEAFSAYDANNLNMGWFGPMGTNPILRGKGIGGILLKRCLDDMKKQGHRVSIIPWVGPIPFYLHYANARLTRVFWRYEKSLD
ncbi:MAG: GNAT family N-acetyltransferase [candidate division KSB1 bacterium]|nr:GNAT family N-acetyltransferase [candidate division KSB1 bacterium]MDZ7334405.1 GNAT family N-acetyltransferase [candidate division KSB1 bacterium]MDZ7358178.1 GNAT family N-acetyltransferase [candidate division KSB1 bacterium]MDZ7377106.1 GNAT family N-acetyltransferase [candidate division KSB1 bacterium]MDZ7398788.1 GNAT family N-acetyltransferase [candidate division KSB1 bacterium]